MQKRTRVLELFEKEDGWRVRAQAGIERNRKGDCVLTVVDGEGNPVKGATMKVVQRSHEFRFGANIFMLDEMENEEKNAEYKRVFKRVFNMATLPFYWNSTEPKKGEYRFAKGCTPMYRRPSTDLCLEFCKKNGIEPREHGLAYEQWVPEWLYGASVERMKEELERRFQVIAERYADKIRTIEVTNEMGIWGNGRTDFYRDPDYVAWCFKRAEKYFPNNQLGINECQDATWWLKPSADNFYLNYIKEALKKGARIDAIGMQYHGFFPKEEEYERSRNSLNPNYVYEYLDLFGELDRPIQLTEVTFPAYSNEEEDEEVQAKMLEYLYTIWFSHESVEQIIYWNVVDGYAHLWSSDLEEIRRSQGDMSIGENYYYGGLLRFDMTPKPAYLKLDELINERWRTSEELTTNERGEVALRGFFGEYDVEIQVGDRSVKKSVSLEKGKKNDVTLTL